MKAGLAGTRAVNEYGNYHIPEGLEHRPAARLALAGKVYESETIRFMRAHAGTGDIIHAGTFFGDFLPALSQALASGATLWAFEANPGNFEAARQTIRLNGLKNVTLVNAALSNSDRALKFRTRDDSGQPLGGLSHVTEQGGPGVVTVEAAMLDYAVPLARRVSILQLDVEGHERQALKGAYHIIHRWQPILILENMGQLHWLNRTFRGVTYTRIGKLHGNDVYVPAGSGITL